MTIKRRLFISNIMMLVVPVILSFMIVAVMMLAFIGILGISVDEFFNDNERFYHVTTLIQESSGKWGDDISLEQIKTDINGMGIKFNEVNNISLAIFKNTEEIYTTGNFVDSPIVNAALSEPGGSYYTIDNICIYTLDAGEYKIIIMDTNYLLYDRFKNSDNRSYLAGLGALLIIAVIIIILITNRFLTRMVIKRIITPLDTLIYGVHQIRDGNLDYRIEYTGKDEFAAVCSDFNEMAGRLMDMVNARIKDEENRKELIAGISHDLRTPLTSIKTYVEGFELGLTSTPQLQKRYLDTIKNKTKDLEHIINQLFLFSKLDIGEFPMQMDQLEIGKWISDFVTGVSEEYNQKGLQIDLVGNPDNVAVNADSIQLRNVLINILENSLKYGNKEQGIIRITCRPDNANVVITLDDNGPGVTEDTLDKIFNIFYRGDKSRSNPSQGSGLGLAISAKIIQLLGGTIKAGNLPEGGLSITITLPVIEKENKSEKDIDS